MNSYKIEGTILVTGGAGYIGGHTVLALLDRGHDVCIIDDLSTGKRMPMHDNVHFYEGSIHDETLVDKVIKDHNIQSILHFAGSIKVDESVTNPLKYYYNNTEGSRRLIACAISNNVDNFIFSSTAAVYGATDDEPVSENFCPLPLNPYGWSKLFTEQQLKDAASISQMRYGIFRYFNVAGADSSLRHGQILDNPTHLIGRSIDALLEQAPPLSIFGKSHPTEDGTGVRDYIHVSDVADAHLAMLADMQQNKKSRLLNLGYGRGSSVLQVIGAIKDIVGKEVPNVFAEPRLGEAPSVIANVSLMNDTLHWQPQHDQLEKIVKSSYNWALKIKSG
ncbi:UDP-glucose 4-epimerase GalE [Kordiimonas aquimaris]|uniref:UDP-glucose 4-epimerase GalE n=1 Tax=Kordiimonas aquimaris TaxID=707591 RepID=UPI0021D3D8D6|nr:UDP-glucose 4-epimerase GalE [Kordiimonas aquimaris]